MKAKSQKMKTTVVVVDRGRGRAMESVLTARASSSAKPASDADGNKSAAARRAVGKMLGKSRTLEGVKLRQNHTQSRHVLGGNFRIACRGIPNLTSSQVSCKLTLLTRRARACRVRGAHHPSPAASRSIKKSSRSPTNGSNCSEKRLWTRRTVAVFA